MVIMIQHYKNISFSFYFRKGVRRMAFLSLTRYIANVIYIGINCHGYDMGAHWDLLFVLTTYNSVSIR